MDKSPDAFRTISEVAEVLDTPAHVLRFWESRFPQVRPVKRAGGRRYYRPSDVALLAGIKRLLHDEGLTIRGVQKLLRDQGVRHVAGLSDETTPVALSPRDEAGANRTMAATEADQPEEVPEAGFIAIEDDEPEPVAPPPSARPTPVQPSLPLFDAVAAPPAAALDAKGPTSAAPRPEVAAPPRPAPRILRDDVTLASLIRALPPAGPGAADPEVAALARRLAALRATLAERAEGGQ